MVMIVVDSSSYERLCVTQPLGGGKELILKTRQDEEEERRTHVTSA